MPDTTLPDTPQDQQDSQSHRGGGASFLYIIAAFLFAALFVALCWFWYAGRHNLSATPQRGATGVGGMTAGDKGEKKH